MRVLITGINGFVGTHLSELLQKENVEIIGIDKQIKPESVVAQHEIDINNYADLQKIIKDIKPDHIYHLAAPAFIPDSYNSPLETFQSIIFGTVNLLEIIRTSSPNSKLLFVGSADEYGMFQGMPFSEDMLPDPCTPYASAKAAASMICRQYAQFYDVNVVRTRSFNHIGPGQSPRFVCSSMARQIATIEKNGEICITLGNLHTNRDFLDVRDVVKAYYMIMCLDANAGELYNICSGRYTSIENILNSFLDLTDLRKREGFIIENQTQYRKFDNVEICGNNNKLRAYTGWEALIPIADTLRDTLNYWREQV